MSTNAQQLQALEQRAKVGLAFAALTGNEHATPCVVGNDGADLLHAGPPIDVVAYFAQQGGAA